MNLPSLLTDWLPWLRRLALGLLIAYWLTLFAATHIPKPPTIPGLAASDKLLHFAAFAVLAVLMAAAAAFHWRPSVRLYASLFAVGATYGLIDELLQVPVPGRSGDGLDWLADVAGVATGLTVFAAVQWAWRRLSRPRPRTALPETEGQ